MDGSVSTLAPVFAAAFATHATHDAFLVGLAASLGAGISMGFAEALSDDGTLTGRGHPLLRGVVCGCMTALGGIGHTLPFLTSRFTLAVAIAVGVVIVELGVITWVRHRFMETPTFRRRCRWPWEAPSFSAPAFSSARGEAFQSCGFSRVPYPSFVRVRIFLARGRFRRAEIANQPRATSQSPCYLALRLIT